MELPDTGGAIFADMMSHGRFQRRLIIPALLSVLQLGTAAVLPILHSKFEVLSAESALESSHSHLCVVLHVESSCTLNSLPQIAGATARDLPISRAPERLIPISVTASALSSRTSCPANGVRAPPLA